MVDLPLLGGPPTPPVSRPTFDVVAGSGSADDWTESLVSLTVVSGLAPHADHAVLTVSASGPGAELDDAGSIGLGYVDLSTETVFTGTANAVRRDVTGSTRIEMTNGGAALARLRVNQSYEQQTAGDIVKDLAGRASVDTDVVEDGPDLPFYVVDDRRGAYEHIAILAKASGYLAHFTAEGALCFRAFDHGEPVRRFHFGEDILELHVENVSRVLTSVTVVGEGAAGSQGQDAWSWIVKDPSSLTGAAGDGEPSRIESAPSLRSAETAQAAAGGRLQHLGFTTSTAQILVPGAPEVAVGDAVEIADGPDDAFNGKALVRAVRHTYSKRSGFTTRISLSRLGDGGLGVLGGLL